MEGLAAVHAALVALEGLAIGRGVARCQTMVTNAVVFDENKSFTHSHFLELILIFKFELVSISNKIFNIHSGTILSKRRFEFLEKDLD